MSHHVLIIALALALAGCKKKESVEKKPAPGSDPTEHTTAPTDDEPTALSKKNSVAGKSGVNTSFLKPAAGPQVRITETTVEGDGLAKELVQRFVRARRPAVLTCYQNALAKTKGLAGTLSATLKIAADGAVSGVETSGMPDEGLNQCLRTLLESLVFPNENKSAVTATLTWAFEPTPREPK